MKDINFECEVVTLAVKEMTTKLQKYRQLGDNPKLHAAINQIVWQVEQIRGHQFDLGTSKMD